MAREHASSSSLRFLVTVGMHCLCLEGSKHLWLRYFPLISWCIYLAAVEACTGWQQACAGGSLLGICHPGGGGLHRTGALPGIYPGDPGLCFLQVPSKTGMGAQIRLVVAVACNAEIIVSRKILCLFMFLREKRKNVLHIFRRCILLSLYILN